jgi:hypothetical protein
MEALPLAFMAGALFAFEFVADKLHQAIIATTRGGVA